jgi:hypothetical protein
MQQQQRFAVVTALAYCQESTGGCNGELIHPDILRAQRFNR